MAVQLLKRSHKCQSITSFRRLCCFVIQFPLYMNVTLSSVCVSLCLVLSEPDHISRLILQDRIFSVLETWWAKVDIFSASLHEAVSCNNHLKVLKVFCTLMHHDSTCLKRRHRSKPNLFRQHPGDSFINTSHAKLLCKFKPKGQLLQISTRRRCSPVFCDGNELCRV